ncbi:unnamed protein product [Lactuca saligna]|uniref:Uncharacterized protein n=1 Tax=Lactuca saligna TaxID=75948 RepID=A0AA35YW64_LACSI|nr:unnamed protein product [Lactuca saligna]
MSKVLYVFAPNANVFKGPHAPDTPIVVQANNIGFSYIIPNQYKNSAIEDFDNYVKNCPLHYIFCDFPEPFYPKQVYMHLTQHMDDWVAILYIVESSEYDEECGEGNNEDEKDDVDDEEDEFDVDTNTLDADMREDFA